MRIRLTLCLLAIAALTAPLFTRPAQAEFYQWRNCYDDGTAPFCEGRCKTNFTMVDKYKVYSRDGWLGKGGACLSGYHVRCCERFDSITQAKRRECTPARYGTPGCPYPKFGDTRRKTSSPHEKNAQSLPAYARRHMRTGHDRQAAQMLPDPQVSRRTHR